MNHPLQFKLKADCTKLGVNGQAVSNTSDILKHFRSFFGSLAQSNLSCTEDISEMEHLSFNNNEQLHDTVTCVEEIEAALKILKLGKSAGPDSLLGVVHGGEVYKLWLKNHIVTLEEVPNTLNVGIVIPVYKRQNPLQINSYCEITLLLMLSKVL